MSSDPHLNIFCSYANHWLEDNVTRALIVTLRALPAAYQRLFLREVLIPRERQEIRDRIALENSQSLEFDLQVHSAYEDEGTAVPDEQLTEATGVLVGLHSGESEASAEEVQSSDAGSARIDATISDPAGDITAVIEVKLGSTMDERQMNRHRERFFGPDTLMGDIRHDVNWVRVISFLDKLAFQLRGRNDAFILEEFLSYTDIVGLSPFTGFKSSHFERRDGHVLERFRQAITKNVRTEPPFKKAEGSKQRINFEGIDPNVWMTYQPGGLAVGLVCGAESKWLASAYRRVILNEGTDFEDLVQRLEETGQQVDQRIQTIIRPHARVFGTYFRNDYIGDVGGRIAVPEELSRVRSIFADKELNPSTRISRAEVTERFRPWLTSLEEDRWGPDGLFPKWRDLDEKGFLVTLYFHLDFLIPSDVLAGKSRDECLQLVGDLVRALASAASDLVHLRS